MSVVNQAAEWLQRFDRKIWPEHRVVVTRQMTEALAKGKVVVADVGAAAGPEERWLTLLDYIHLLTFEPVERVGSGIPGVEGTHFAVALGGTRGEATLNLLNCAGLYCDRVSEMAGEKREVRIVPFRGEYYKLKREREFLVKNLIYPVPDPQFPFLGVHFTRLIGGGIEAGPNAVLAGRPSGVTIRYRRPQPSIQARGKPA